MNSSGSPVRLVAPVIRIARIAGEAILEVYGSGDFGTSAKADSSPVTQADLRAHAVIHAGLRDLTPDLPVLSEESEEVPYATRRSWERYWLVDPLDGTKEFLARNGEFTVNIALVVGHHPALGIVYVPARDTIYWGVPAEGAWRSVGGVTATPIRVRSRATSPVRVVASRSHRGGSLAPFLANLGAHELLSVGSALKLCMVAEGSADVYPRLGPTSEWDTAAAHAVVAAAGGTVVTTDGEPLRYNTHTGMLNPDFLAYADRTRNWVGMLR
jgi:3'(2'), 5'-bisphosphate nucleotidase